MGYYPQASRERDPFFPSIPLHPRLDLSSGWLSCEFSRLSKKKKKSLLAGYNPVGVFFWDELQEKLLIVTGLGLYNASQLYQVQGSAKCFGEAQGNYITIPFRRDILPTLLETGKLLSFSGTLFFFLWLLHNLTFSLLYQATLLLRSTQRRFPPKCIEDTFLAIQGTFRSLEMHSKVEEL